MAMQNAGRGRDRDRVGAAARIHGLRLPHIRRPPPKVQEIAPAHGPLCSKLACKLQ